MMLTELPATNAVRVGPLFYKPGRVHDVLGQSVRLVVFEHVYEGESTFSESGSCTLISHGGRAFVVTTRHQLKLEPGAHPSDTHLDALRFSASEDGYLKNIPVDRCFYETDNPAEDYHDLLFFGVERNWLRTSADRHCFIPVEGFSRAERRVSFFYGHPLTANEFQYEPLHAFVRTAFMDGRLDREFRSEAAHFRRYAYDKTDYEVNGFSGGAVFSLVGTIDTQFETVFDGIIVRGGNGSMYVVDSDYILMMLAALRS